MGLIKMPSINMRSQNIPVSVFLVEAYKKG